MPTFGFSAFLKLLALNARPQRTELRKRLLPSVEGGYDFHRRFRLLAHRYLSGGESLPDLFVETEGYGNVAEGRAAREALEFLEDWRADMPGRLFAFGSRTWESASGAFKVRFTPDFGIEIDGVRVGVHIWKTQRPPLDARMTYAALSLFPDLYADEVGGPEDFAVLSVIDGRLYRLSDVDNPSVMAGRVMVAIENLIDEIGDEIASPQPPIGDQPSSPPTAPS
ncbi:Uncharacterised protein [Brevundimonas diminuta]|uniref:Uncharacterized protein n=1 Tax=Brevundimonas diminuta TaxID=293 RepID=A0A2X1C7E0_BREDI|nr:Uncharacterised protein [Brevundimonas diminuta]